MDATIMDIKAALKNYCCQYSQNEDGDGLPLVDVLTPQEDTNISRGIAELNMIAEHIADELFYKNRG